jgi:hypothetical protein
MVVFLLAERLEAEEPTLKSIQSQLLEFKNLLEQRLFEAEFLIPPKALERVQDSVFLLMESKESNIGVGVGVFYSSNFAVTANHNLRPLPQDKRGTILYAECNGKLIILKVHFRNIALDYALLSFDGMHTYLEPWQDAPQSLMGRRVTLCAFQIGISEHLSEFQTSDMGVMSASIVKVSRDHHHLVMQSDTWPGDSGGAVVLHDGRLIGIHLEGVNSLREKFCHDALDEAGFRSEVASSLESAANSVATGCIALYVGVFTSPSASTLAGAPAGTRKQPHSAQAKSSSRLVRMRGPSSSQQHGAKSGR